MDPQSNPDHISPLVWYTVHAGFRDGARHAIEDCWSDKIARFLHPHMATQDTSHLASLGSCATPRPATPASKLLQDYTSPTLIPCLHDEVVPQVQHATTRSCYAPSSRVQALCRLALALYICYRPSCYLPAKRTARCTLTSGPSTRKSIAPAFCVTRWIYGQIKRLVSHTNCVFFIHPTLSNMRSDLLFTGLVAASAVTALESPHKRAQAHPKPKREAVRTEHAPRKRQTSTYLNSDTASTSLTLQETFIRLADEEQNSPSMAAPFQTSTSMSGSRTPVH